MLIHNNNLKIPKTIKALIFNNKLKTNQLIELFCKVNKENLKFISIQS